MPGNSKEGFRSGPKLLPVARHTLSYLSPPFWVSFSPFCLFQAIFITESLSESTTATVVISSHRLWSGRTWTWRQCLVTDAALKKEILQALIVIVFCYKDNTYSVRSTTDHACLCAPVRVSFSLSLCVFCFLRAANPSRVSKRKLHGDTPRNNKEDGDRHKRRGEAGTTRPEKDPDWWFLANI